MWGFEESGQPAGKWNNTLPNLVVNPYIRQWSVVEWGDICCIGIRGDVNGDGDDINILDLTFMVDFIFRGSGDPGPCPEERDVNGDGDPSSIIDLTFIVDRIFRGGPAPGGC